MPQDARAARCLLPHRPAARHRGDAAGAPAPDRRRRHGYDRSIFPVHAVGSDYDGGGSLYARMDAQGGRPRRIMQSLKAVEVPEEVAPLLGIRPGAAVLAIHRIGYGAQGNALEDALSWYRGDRYEYIAEITG
ncbi:UTRA domain-containing protein [Taklimakanibacter lacteus]|uniref:UTRA domain-containing protein n=1 Tax=Taklimakanibacter lacteus TaxID=2268456 RepID=UPI0034D4C2B4